MHFEFSTRPRTRASHWMHQQNCIDLPSLKITLSDYVICVYWWLNALLQHQTDMENWLCIRMMQVQKRASAHTHQYTWNQSISTVQSTHRTHKMQTVIDDKTGNRSQPNVCYDMEKLRQLKCGTLSTGDFQKLLNWKIYYPKHKLYLGKWICIFVWIVYTYRISIVGFVAVSLPTFNMNN